MFKRTIFGVTLAPAFALGVALTAYAANGWHGTPSTLRNHTQTTCDSAQTVRVEHRDAVRLYELTAGRQVKIGPSPAAPAPCVSRADRN